MHFDITDYNSFWKIHCFTFFPYKSMMDQIWHGRKIGQGQPRIIIWTNLVLKYLLLHTKFQGHQPFGFGEDFLRFLQYIWAWRPSWSCDQDRLNNLSFPHLMEALYEIWLQLAQWFQRRRCMKMLTTHTYMWTTEAYQYYKLTYEPKGSGELKMKLLKIPVTVKMIHRPVTYYYPGRHTMLKQHQINFIWCNW